METGHIIDVPARRTRRSLRAAPRPRTPPWRLHGSIHPAKPFATPAELYAQCGERLAILLLELATWDRMPQGCAVSDTRFLVVSFSPEPRIGPYVQFLSAPTETTVLWEVASLDYMPNLEKLLSQAKHQELTRRGFTKGRLSPSNYSCEVMVDGLEAARRVASAALEILVDVFDYQGLQALELFYVGDRRARDGLVYHALRPDELVMLLCRQGLGARFFSGNVCLVRPVGTNVRVTPLRKGERGSFLEYVATARFAPHPRLTDRFVHDWNAGTGSSRLHLEPAGDAVLRLLLPLRHGMSESQIAGMVDNFAAEAETLRAALGGVH